MSYQRVKLKISISRDKLKKGNCGNCHSDNEEIIAWVADTPEKERERFLESAAEFLFHSMKSAGLIKIKEGGFNG